MLTTAQARTSPGAIAALVNALGTEEFEHETLRLLHDLSGADHYTIYRVRNGKTQFLGGASVSGRHALRLPSTVKSWPNRSYADMQVAREVAASNDHAVVMHDELKQALDPVLDSALKHFRIADRVMVCGRTDADLYAVSALRSDNSGEFADEELQTLAQTADVLIAVCAKHAALHWDKDKAATHFGSVEKIEGNLRASDWGLSERELQVSARILFGISAYGIALDLGLGEETVATYRKRLYARLRIGGRHELLQRYLKLL